MKQNRKVILITGAATGIGSSIAKSYIDEGHNVHICDYDKKRLQEFLDKNPNATGNLADVSNPNDVKDTFNIINNLYKKLNILINNAGISGESALTENISIEGWQQTINTNLNGMFYVTQLAIPLLKENKSSSIINMSSQMAHVGGPIRSVYNMTKAGLEGLTRGMAIDLAKNNIRVNTVCPTFVVTPMTKKFLKSKKFKNDTLKKIPMGKFAELSDVATAVAFLASDSSKMITGTSILVDGGWTAI